jgi:hypothetical protein
MSTLRPSTLSKEMYSIFDSSPFFTPAYNACPFFTICLSAEEELSSSSASSTSLLTIDYACNPTKRAKLEKEGRNLLK